MDQTSQQRMGEGVPSPTYPRPANYVQQIEISAECNLACPYCPHPKMARSKESAGWLGQPDRHMTLQTFDRVLEWMRYFAERGTQPQMALCGIGEPLLNPDFTEMCRRLRATPGLENLPVLFSTNGLLLNEDICQRLLSRSAESLVQDFARYHIRVDISLHRPEKAGPAIELCRRYGVLGAAASFASTAAVDWAGQVDWFVSAPTKNSPCPWLFNGGINVLYDGTFTTCCFDTQPGRVLGEDGQLKLNPSPLSGAFGHCTDPVGMPMMMEPFDLCGPCHHRVD